jgi:hypothetical protein
VILRDGPHVIFKQYGKREEFMRAPAIALAGLLLVPLVAACAPQTASMSQPAAPVVQQATPAPAQPAPTAQQAAPVAAQPMPMAAQKPAAAYVQKDTDRGGGGSGY